MSRINSEGEYGSRESSETLARALSLLLPNSFSPITFSLSYLCTAAAQASSSVCCGMCPLRWMRERKKAARTLHAVLCTRYGHWLLWRPLATLHKVLQGAATCGERRSKMVPLTSNNNRVSASSQPRSYRPLLCTLTSGDHWLLCNMSYKGLSPAENAGARSVPSPPTTTASPLHHSRAALRRCSSISRPPRPDDC